MNLKVKSVHNMKVVNKLIQNIMILHHRFIIGITKMNGFYLVLELIVDLIQHLFFQYL